MNEVEVKKANDLIKQREQIESALKKKMIKNVENNVNWHFGSGLYPYFADMVQANKECLAISEQLMSERAKSLLKKISKELSDLGVDTTGQSC